MSLMGIKTKNTDTGTVKVYMLSAASRYQQFTLHTGTPIMEDDGQNFVFATTSEGNLMGIKTKNTGTGGVEVHMLSAASRYQQFIVQTGTPITEDDGQNFVFATTPEGNLMGIKTKNTGTGGVEVHMLSAASRYQQFIVQTGTPITEDDGQNFVFSITSEGNLMGIKTKNTGTGKVEVHILSAASGYQQFIVQTATSITEHDGQNFVFATTPEGDLLGIKTKNTDMGMVEVLLIPATFNYQQYIFYLNMPIIEHDGQNFVFATTTEGNLAGVKTKDTVTLTSERAEALILNGEAPDNLKVQGDLNIYRAISHLPAGLQVDGGLWIQASSLEELPAGLKCYALYADESSLKRLPEDLRVTNLISLKNCVQLEALPAGLKANKLILDGCHALTTLPEDLQIAQEISLNDCTSLQVLPAGLKTGCLNLRACHALKILPEDLDVFFLDIAGCIAMNAYPERGPSTLGLFNMQGCIRLPGIPPWLRVVAQMDISDCPAITQLPATLQVRSWVDIANTSLTSLPEALKNVQLRWHDVHISTRIAFAPETITPEEIIAEQNIELRRVMIERIGYKTFLEATQAEVLDADEDPGGQRQLLRVAIPGDEDLVVLSVSCPSTSRSYILRVPPTMKGCHQAAAWIAGFENPDDYQPLIET